MSNKLRLKVHNGTSFFAVFVVFCMVLSMLSSVWMVPSVQAKSSRAAIVTELTGDVSVRKAGGSKSFTAYKEMTLNQGDFIITGYNSSLTLKIADRNDEITIGDNTEISITELLDSNDGKTSKFKMWAGSAWAKVKSLVSSEDEYEIETPTAVMGVRGTQFLTTVDPLTGRTSMVVAAGVVNSTTNVPQADGSQSTQGVNVYPSQQISLNDRDQAQDLRTQVGYVDINSIVSQASPKVLEAILKSYADIDKENKEIIQKLLKDLEAGIESPDGSILKLTSLEDLNKVSANFDALISNIAKAAVDAGKLSKDFINRLNEQINDPAKKIDLNHVLPLNNKAGIDPEVEALKKLQQEKTSKSAEENARIAQMQQQQADLLARLQKERERLEAANKQLENDAREKAKQQLASGTNEGSTTTGGSTSTSGGSSSSGRPSGSSRPAQPVLVSPTAEVTTFNPAVIRWKAPLGVIVNLYNGSDLVSSVEGKGDEEATMTLGVLADGTYRFKAEAVRNGIPSVQLSLPPVIISDTPILISPKTDWITNVPVVVAKGPLNTKVKVLNQGSLVAEADGKGDQEVSIPLTSLVTDKAAVYDKLTLVTERSGKLSNPVQLPKITTDGSMGVILKSVRNPDNTVTATLALKNFVNAKALYAAEMHLAYDKRLSYNGDGTIAKNPNAVFGSLPQSVEILKEYKSNDQSELIYAATNYEAGSGANLITVDGEMLLIDIPLTLSGTDINNLKVKLLYFKIVDKNGNVVSEVNLQNNPVEVIVK
ncbi:FecR domain-containing protein [Paenibacillus sp. RC67]|uniref:FecR domain-containing protein n=1 Tax=Paenibacillus sp. RC67 TaxID=3039392 RepID=UPI0024AE6E37|nr:FecR domain-containing protein [Paenibacillus sp. RC67]